MRQMDLVVHQWLERDYPLPQKGEEVDPNYKRPHVNVYLHSLRDE